MYDADEKAFYELLLDTDQAIRPGCAARTPGAMNIIFEDLAQYSFDTVRKALAMHRRDPERGQWPPNSAHIEHQISIRRPVVWLAADEAWSKVPKLEGQPGLMTDETVQALAVAQPFLNQMHQGHDGRLTHRPDMMAARMAFKGCYERLVERAKLERRGPVYFVSPGGSFEEQQAVVEEGQRLGLLAAPRVDAVPMLETAKRTPGAKPDLKALLLTMKPKELPPPEAQDYAK